MKKEKIIEIARYVVDNNCTLKVASKHFDVNYTTISKNINKYLESYDKELYAKLKRIFYDNQNWKGLDQEKLTEIANYIIDNQCSLRMAGKHFGISHATLSEAINSNLPSYDKELYSKFKLVRRNNNQRSGIRKEDLGDLDLGDLFEIANYLVDNQCTLSVAAHHFGVPASTANYRIHKKLKFYDEELYAKVKFVLDKNRQESYARAGAATRKVYEERRKRREQESGQ